MISDLIVRFDHSGEKACLFRRLCCTWVGELGEHIQVIVPTGFKTDFASIPKGVRSLIPQLGKWTAPAVIHDFLYWCGPSIGYDQAMADSAFLNLMEQVDVRSWRKWAIYGALRAFGSFAWNKHRKLDHCEDNCIQEDCE